MTQFKDLPIGTLFVAHGNMCQKMSSRTAILLDYGRCFYFKQKEVVACLK